jgi:hypothetical protein
MKRTPRWVGDFTTAVLTDDMGPLEGSWVKTLFLNGLAGAEDYLRCGLATAQPVVTEARPVRLKHVNPELCKERFTRGDVPRGSYPLTLTTVYTVLARHPEPWEEELMGANVGGPEWSVAAMILGMNCLEPQTRQYLVTARMHWVRLECWPQQFKQWATAARRCPALEGVDDKLAGYRIRKVFNCCLRNKDAADWEAEYSNRTDGVKVHFALDGLNLSHTMWTRMVAAKLKGIATDVVSSTINAQKLPSMEEWWASRWGWAPSGSTSLRRKIKDGEAADERLGTQSRPGKKTIVENLPEDFPQQTLLARPGDVARASTKNEPGGKNRALYAHMDEAFFVASYASLHVEKFMNTGGMVGKQTPADVARWLAASNQMLPADVWTSIDYADFNQGHETKDMAMLDFAFAAAWKAQAKSRPELWQRYRCSLWVALSHFRRYVSWPSGGATRILGGLWSGHRNTARDNTILHKAYAEVADAQLKKFMPHASKGYEAYCGDDEDTKHNSFPAALMYYLIHDLNGHALGPAKQMAGRTHEFLQRIAVPGQHTIRPLFAMLAQTASGNWYKDNYTWYGNAVGAVSDNCWELYVRGMPIRWARTLAAETLNAMMRVPTEQGWYQLEWWAMRNGTKGHPLWVGLPGAENTAPALTAKVAPRVGVPTNATDAWINKLKPYAPGASQAQWDTYRRELAADSYSKVLVDTRLTRQREETLDLWPPRSSTVPQACFGAPAPEPPPFNVVLGELTAQPGDRRPASIDEVASRFGMDARFLQLAGGFKEILPRLPPEMAARYEEPCEVRLVDWRYHATDPAITSWATNTQAVAMKRSRGAVAKTWRPHDWKETLTIIMAPNLAGKSTFAKKVRANGGKLVDGDEILNGVEQLRQLLRWGRHHRDVDPQAVWNCVQEAMAKAMATTIMWQTNPQCWLPRKESRSFAIKVIVVDPGCAELLSRRDARWWTEEAVKQRYDKWKRVVAEFLGGDSLTEIEKRGVSEHTSFEEVYI